LIKRQDLQPCVVELGGNSGRRLLRAGGHEREPCASDHDLLPDHVERLDDCALVDHVLRIELQAVHRISRTIKEVTVDDTCDVALVVGEVGDRVELIERLTDPEYGTREHVMEPRRLRHTAALAEVAIDKANHWLGSVATVEKELGDAPIGDQVATGNRDGLEFGSRIDAQQGERELGRGFSRRGESH